MSTVCSLEHRGRTRGRCICKQWWLGCRACPPKIKFVKIIFFVKSLNIVSNFCDLTRKLANIIPRCWLARWRGPTSPRREHCNWKQSRRRWLWYSPIPFWPRLWIWPLLYEPSTKTVLPSCKNYANARMSSVIGQGRHWLCGSASWPLFSIGDRIAIPDLRFDL